MPQDERTEAAAARAARLREQISGIEKTSAEPPPRSRTAGDGGPNAEPALSPRDFVQKRMQELDSKT